MTPPRVASSRSRGLDEPHIGKYRLIKTIGKGNFAKVKLAKHVPTGREVTFIVCNFQPNVTTLCLANGGSGVCHMSVCDVCVP